MKRPTKCESEAQLNGTYSHSLPILPFDELSHKQRSCPLERDLSKTQC